MEDLLIGITFLLIIFGLALVFPLVIVLKWQNRPLLALVIATILCSLFVAVLLQLAGMAVDEPTGPEFLITIGVLGLIFGLPILAFFQWRRRRKRKGLSKKAIEDVF